MRGTQGDRTQGGNEPDGTATSGPGLHSGESDRRRIIELERVAALGWRAVDEQWMGNWLLRAAGGFTGRANSALVLGSPDRSLADAVDATRRWYARRGLPATISLPFPLSGPGDDPLDRLLAAGGWTLRSGPAMVLTAAAGDLAPPDGADTLAGPRVSVSETPDEAWRALYHYRGQELPPVAARLLVSAPWQRFVSLRTPDGATVAIGRLAVADGWAGVTAMEVAPDHRRRGYGTRVLHALGGLARQRGAGRLYLQVDEDNTAARALYQRSGFTPSHLYHYRIAPAR